MWSTISFDHVLIIVGRFLKSGELFVVFNVYSSCDVSSQQALWVNISNRLVSFASQNICVCGDFNAVQCGSERQSVGNSNCQVGTAAFNYFIDSNLLIDLPLWGRNFTWYRGDGKSMSRIDRFLLSDNWCLTWPSCSQMASTRGLSDHCPLVLFVDERNWVPRPLRMLKCWESFPGYRILVEEKWRSFDVDSFMVISTILFML
jgi:endonuclease/exonuclease/phosphatase family metal-dependent hydrolase